jgi:hypothetical protein
MIWLFHMGDWAGAAMLLTVCVSVAAPDRSTRMKRGDMLLFMTILTVVYPVLDMTDLVLMQNWVVVGE